MKTYILPSLKLTLVLILICAAVYPLLVAGISRLAPGGGSGRKILLNGKVVGYEQIGQRFSGDDYFQGRPSAVNYNAAGSGGSNKGPVNPDYLSELRSRIDTFLVHNPGVKKEQIPADLVTASGSGLDPDISLHAAMIQVPRIARCRQINESDINQLVRAQAEKPLFGIFGIEKINVLKLNVALINLSKKHQPASYEN